MGSSISHYLYSRKEPQQKMKKYNHLKYLPLLFFQLLLMVLFFVFVKYEGPSHANLQGFEGTHVMIFVGFGFLMTFLKKYSYSALGFNLFLAAIVIQWAFLCQNFYHMKNNTIYATKATVLEADIMAATVLITFGALLGLASDLQLLFIGIIEVVFACANFYVVADKFKAADVGGSIAIHAFGAYFGLAASWAMRPRKKTVTIDAPTTTAGAVDLGGPSYVSDTTAMIGTLFLWVYWPNFNSALTTTNSEYNRAIINTYLALASATVTTFVMSSIVSHHQGKLDMVHIQNSTLAGGVAVGSVCNMHITPGGAVAIGIGAGVISVLGYRYLTPWMTKRGIRDTCGVHNLHGMPGVYSGLLSVIFAFLATVEIYGLDLAAVFPAMAGPISLDDDTPPASPAPEVAAKTGISTTSQALNQLYATLCTVVTATVTGVITGLLAKMRFLPSLKENEYYDDAVNWELPG